MIKIESTNGRDAVVVANGSTQDLTVETIAVISGIYNQLKHSAPPFVAAVYRKMIMRAVAEDGIAWEEHPNMTGITLDKGMWDKYGSK